MNTPLKTVRTLLIVNPVAGRGQTKKICKPLVRLFEENNMRVSVMSTGKRGDAESIAAAFGGGYDLVVCAGGDGTLSEVVTGLMKLPAKPRVGYIPVGTANDYAASLGLPGGVLEAGRRIIGGQVTELDVGSFEDKSFTYVASFGALTEIAYTTPQEMKRRLGWLAYALEGLRHLKDIRPRRVKVRTGDVQIEDDFVFGAVSNTTRIAGVITLDKSEVALDDGEFEVTLVRRPRGPVALVRTVLGVLSHKYDRRDIEHFKASDVEISCEQGLEWCIDGEDGGKYRRASIKTRKKELSLVM